MAVSRVGLPDKKTRFSTVFLNILIYCYCPRVCVGLTHAPACMWRPGVSSLLSSCPSVCGKAMAIKSSSLSPFRSHTRAERTLQPTACTVKCCKTEHPPSDSYSRLRSYFRKAPLFTSGSPLGTALRPGAGGAEGTGTKYPPENTAVSRELRNGFSGD